MRRPVDFSTFGGFLHPAFTTGHRVCGPISSRYRSVRDQGGIDAAHIKHCGGVGWALATLIAFSSVRATDEAPKLVTEHIMIEAADPGIKLYVRNKRPEDMKQFTSEKTLVFVHGATQPAEATFDLPLE